MGAISPQPLIGPLRSAASWTVVVPVLATAVLALAWGRDLSGLAVVIVTLLLAGAVLAAVHHAEVVAHRVGEPFGSLVLAVAVTVIEVALIVTLMAGGHAKLVSPTIERGVSAAGLPLSFVGVVIALLVLLPEALAAVRAAHRERLQISLNLAYGSAMASIGLTIPTIAVASIWLPVPLLLGLGATHIVLLALTAVVAVLTVVPGRATLLQAGVHLALLAAFLVLAVSP